MNQIRSASLLLPALLLSLAMGTTSEGRPISETDLYRFHWVADPQLSPDGSRIAYVEVTVSAKHDGYETSIWLVPFTGREAPRLLTSGKHDLAPAWSPDGKSLAFLRAAKEAGKLSPPQIYLLQMEGGDAQRLTNLKGGAGAPVWSPDGKTIAFASSGAKQGKQEDDSTADNEKSDVRVITRAYYRLNGAGYLDSTSRDHIWTASVPAGGGDAKLRQLTRGEFEESQPTWSPDGTRLYFISDRVAESYFRPPDSDLFSIPAEGGEITRVASIDGVIQDYALSHDGKRAALIGNLNGKPLRSYDEADLLVADIGSNSPPRNLTASYDFGIDEGISADQHAPRGRLSTSPVWIDHDSAIVVRAAEHGSSNLKRVSLAGQVTPLTTGKSEVVAYSTDGESKRLALVLSSPTLVGDIFVSEVGKQPEQLTQRTKVNSELFGQLDISQPEEFWYQSFDGTRIQAWIQKPPGFNASQRYPLILEIHGGPHSAYGYSFTHEFLWLAAQGYVVLYTNPRGSTSYGQKFGNIIQYRYPGDDYRDLMVGVDSIVRRGYIDTKRLGVTGGSGGGLLTNWIITQTDRFAAAVSQRSIADWASFWYDADFTQFTPFWFRKTPWQNPEEYRVRSPITYVDRVKTPLMLVEGESDFRTPPGSGGEMMFRALKYLKKPVVMVRFPEETHELSRSGKPRHRVERLQHIRNWFDKYLKEKEVPGYAENAVGR
jgi:dipeptidyl aminopeptidase/acylaminoacyl peptidase